MSQQPPDHVVKTVPWPTMMIAGVFIYAAVVCSIFGLLAFR